MVAQFAHSLRRRSERQRLWQHWQQQGNEGRGSPLDEAADALQRYSDAIATLQIEHDRGTLNVLKAARVVGMTTSGVAMLQRVVAALHPKVRPPARSAVLRCTGSWG
jgi:hypothetical protein